MIDPNQIPFLIRLLDDESKMVQEEVSKALLSFGPLLREELKKHFYTITIPQQAKLIKILQIQKKLALKQNWPSCFKMDSEQAKLEKALMLLAEYLQLAPVTTQLSNLLDGLALSYKENHSTVDYRQLATFLFKEKGLKGNEKDYYNPQNSNLIYVIQQRKGIPISLTTIYILVGQRLGLKIEGCPFPGHFLARVVDHGRTKFVDCFNKGQVMEAKDIRLLRQDLNKDIDRLLAETADAETILKRFLINLGNAYKLQKDEDNCLLMTEITEAMDIETIHQKIK